MIDTNMLPEEQIAKTSIDNTIKKIWTDTDGFRNLPSETLKQKIQNTFYKANRFNYNAVHDNNAFVGYAYKHDCYTGKII